MTFNVNTSPFAGREGKFVTSRNIKERLDRELERNLALKVEPGDTADTFIVCGRGALHITILIENMRREGYEFCIGPPQVITKLDEDGKKLEPFEEAVVEVPEEYNGSVVELLSNRKGEMLDSDDERQGNHHHQVQGSHARSPRPAQRHPHRHARYRRAQHHLRRLLPVRGRHLACARTARSSRSRRVRSTSYALFSAQERGDHVRQARRRRLRGQVVGIHQRNGDLKVNVAKRKAATNVRSNKDATVVLNEPKSLSLDDCVEYIAKRRARGGDAGEHSHPQEPQDGQKGDEAAGDEEVRVDGEVSLHVFRSLK